MSQRDSHVDSDDSSDADLKSQERLAELVGKFIGMMKAGNMSRLDLKYGDLRLSLRAHGDGPLPVESQTKAGVVATSSVTVLDDVIDTTTHVITAPMIGTFYAAPAPGEPPFVQPGDHVAEGQTVGIIEAMKIMNEIAADRSGTIVEIVARNAQSVEYGSPLVRLDPDHS